LTPLLIGSTLNRAEIASRIEIPADEEIVEREKTLARTEGV
jgi:hypothetical protein